MSVAASWKRLLPALYIAILLSVNVYVARELFAIGYTRHLGSPEGSFIAIARMWLEHPGDMLWWPYWDAGMPLQHTYFPLVPAASALVAKLAQITLVQALHAFEAAAYCLGPVTLFLMAWRMSGAAGTSFGAALAYSLCSPSVVFPRILTDLGDVQAARRLQNLLFYGESPHIVSLTLLPVALLFLYRALEGRRYAALLAGIAAALVTLANAFGGAILAIAALGLVLAADVGSPWKNWARLAAIGALAYVWISPLIPPSVIETIRRNSQTSGGDFRPTVWSGVAALAILAGLALVRSATRKMQLLPRYATLLGFALAAIIGVWMSFGISVVPQPHRYHLEFEMAACMAGAFGLQLALGRFPRTARRGTIVLLAAAAIVQTAHYRQYARQLIQSVDIEQRIEYRIAAWFREHLPGARVMAPGSTGLWLSVFVDNPQMSSGHEPSTPNWIQRVAVFTILSGQNAGAEDGAIAIKWLRLFGVQAIAVAGPGSQEIYHAIGNPAKFEGLLPVLWREGGDTIYAVPQRSKSLVYVIPESSVIQQAPIHGLDVAPLEPYLAALDDPTLPVPEVAWDTHHSATIRANLRPDQVISIQMNYHPGWRASVDGEERRVYADQAGLIVLEPRCSETCEIRLEYGLSSELYFALGASALLMVAVIAIMGGRALRRR